MMTLDYPVQDAGSEMLVYRILNGFLMLLLGILMILMRFNLIENVNLKWFVVTSFYNINTQPTPAWWFFPHTKVFDLSHSQKPILPITKPMLHVGLFVLIYLHFPW